MYLNKDNFSSLDEKIDYFLNHIENEIVVVRSTSRIILNIFRLADGCDHNSSNIGFQVFLTFYDSTKNKYVEIFTDLLGEDSTIERALNQLIEKLPDNLNNYKVINGNLYQRIT